MLNILKNENIPATFYLNGKQLDKFPDLARLLIDSGHEIGNHSFSHPRMLFMSYSEVADQIERTTDSIRRYGYKGKIRFRPPYGKSLFMLPLYLSNNDITTVTWDVAPEWFVDGADTASNIHKRTLEQVNPGSIILLHVMYGDGATLQALPGIIQSLKQKGYQFATVSDLLALDAEKSSL